MKIWTIFFGALLCGVLLAGCSSVRPVSAPEEQVLHLSEAERLTEAFASLRDSLLLSPYPRRVDLHRLYGHPTSTTTNQAGLLVDEHQPSEHLVVRTYWTASNPNQARSLQWAAFTFPEDPAQQEKSWRFERPQPIPDIRVLKRKVELLDAWKEQLISDSAVVAHTNIFWRGDLQRTYALKKHFDLPVNQEIWTYKGGSVAEGIYRDYRPWSGRFLKQIYNTEYFREINYEEGVLQHSILPDWQELDDPARVTDPFMQGPASDLSLAEAGSGTSRKLLRLADENDFLTWAEKHNVSEGYRVIAKPSFSPAILFHVILQSTRAPATVEWIVTDGAAGYPETMTEVASRTSKRLARSDVRNIRKIVDHSLFWSSKQKHSVGALDGWSLHYEGIRNGLYTYRRYFNTDAVAFEALAYTLLGMIPQEEIYPGRADSIDFYMRNLRKCTMDAIRIMEHKGHAEIVDAVIMDGDAEALARCIQMARGYLHDTSVQASLTGDFAALLWDSNSDLLVHPNGHPIVVDTRKEVAIWDDSWMYNLTLHDGTESGKKVVVSVKFTPAATVALYRKTQKPESLSTTALTVLQHLDLNPDLATVIDWSLRWGRRDANDEMEVVLVVPPLYLSGAYSHTITINHTQRSYGVRQSGGIMGGGSSYSHEFLENW